MVMRLAMASDELLLGGRFNVSLVQMPGGPFPCYVSLVQMSPRSCERPARPTFFQPDRKSVV